MALVSINVLSFSNVLGVSTEEDDVLVGARVTGCFLTIDVRPEKRIPVVNNWGTDLRIIGYDSTDTLRFDVTTTSDIFGNAYVDICAQGYEPPFDTYTFYVKGLSHLRKEFPGVTAFEYADESVSFLGPNDLLLAGDTSVADDNAINALDISTQVKNIYTNSVIDDLNQDGIVNSLDIANTITNFYLLGE